MKYIKNAFIAILILFSLIYTFDLNYLIKGIRVVYLNGYSDVFIDDNKYFDTVQVETSNNPEPWIKHINYNQKNTSKIFDEYNSEMETASFIIIKNDSILTEKYYNGYDENSVINSFSMAKTLIYVSLAKAIEEGYIKSLEQKVVDFIPELKGEFANEVRVIDLASMHSGMEWTEPSLNPFSVLAKTYFVKDLNKLILDQPFVEKPGIKFHYSSGNTQILSIIIERATGEKIRKWLFVIHGDLPLNIYEQDNKLQKSANLSENDYLEWFSPANIIFCEEKYSDTGCVLLCVGHDLS